jgi:hypothetical protein
VAAPRPAAKWAAPRGGPVTSANSVARAAGSLRCAVVPPCLCSPGRCRSGHCVRSCAPVRCLAGIASGIHDQRALQRWLGTQCGPTRLIGHAGPVLEPERAPGRHIRFAQPPGSSCCVGITSGVVPASVAALASRPESMINGLCSAGSGRNVVP